MFLKFRYRLGFRADVPRGGRLDQLAAVLSDPARGFGAHPTTLMKITDECGTSAIDGLNEALLAKAAGGPKCSRQPDAGRHHRRPGQCGLSTDSGLLAKGVAKNGQGHQGAQGQGPGDQDRVTGPDADGGSRRPRHRGQPSSPVRRGQDEVRAINAELAAIAVTASERGTPGHGHARAPFVSSATPYREGSPHSWTTSSSPLLGSSRSPPTRVNASTASPL